MFTQWNLLRWIRLGLGIALAFQAIEMKDSLAGLLSIFILYQAISNTGCCGASGCSPLEKKSDSSDLTETQYVEVITKNEPIKPQPESHRQ